MKSQIGNYSGNYDILFENSVNTSRVKIDHANYPNNVWQIGKPSKPILNNAYTIPNVIITDSLNPYPINNVSVFQIKNTADLGFTHPQDAVISGEYFVNSDTLVDFGKIEFSPNNGTTWIDLINSTTYSNSIFWYTIKPVLSGNSHGWKNFYVNIANLGPILNIHFGDTVIWRFSFFSDNIQTNKDGLMYDNLHFEDIVEGIKENSKGKDLFSLNPNPFNSNLKIQFTSSTSKTISIRLLSIDGKVLKEETHSKILDDTIEIDTKDLSPGIYFAELNVDGFKTIRKVIKQG